MPWKWRHCSAQKGTVSLQNNYECMYIFRVRTIPIPTLNDLLCAETFTKSLLNLISILLFKAKNKFNPIYISSNWCNLQCFGRLARGRGCTSLFCIYIVGVYLVLRYKGPALSSLVQTNSGGNLEEHHLEITNKEGNPVKHLDMKHTDMFIENGDGITEQQSK